MSYLLQDFFYIKRSSKNSKASRYDVKLHESELYFLKEDGKNGFVAQLKNITGLIIVRKFLTNFKASMFKLKVQKSIFVFFITLL